LFAVRLLESILEKIKNEQVAPYEFLLEVKQKDKYLRPSMLQDLLQSEFGRHISGNAFQLDREEIIFPDGWYDDDVVQYPELYIFATWTPI